MTPQAAFWRRRIITLVALVWFSPFIICVSRGNINIDPIFTEIIISKIMLHHQSPPSSDCCPLRTVSFKLRTWELRIRRVNKWKWESLLNTIWKAARPSTPDQTRTDNEYNDRSLLSFHSSEDNDKQYLATVKVKCITDPGYLVYNLNFLCKCIEFVFILAQEIPQVLNSILCRLGPLCIWKFSMSYHNDDYF